MTINSLRTYKINKFKINKVHSGLICVFRAGHVQQTVHVATGGLVCWLPGVTSVLWYSKGGNWLAPGDQRTSQKKTGHEKA